MPLKTKPFDEADYLTSPARMTGYLNECIATGDPAIIQHALGAIARARGMTKVAKQTGEDRGNLYRSLSPAHAASFGTMLRVFNALGLQMKVVTARTPTRKPRTRRAKVSTVIAGAHKAAKPGRNA